MRRVVEALRFRRRSAAPALYRQLRTGCCALTIGALAASHSAGAGSHPSEHQPGQITDDPALATLQPSAAAQRPDHPVRGGSTAALSDGPARQAEHAALRDHLKTAVALADSFADRFDAEVWLLDMSTRLEHFIADPGERLHLLRAIHREAKAADLKPDLVLALIEVESGFDPFAISRVGAQGLMQVMPFWKNEIGRPEDNLTDIATNLRYGCQILKFYMDRENGNWMPALARYNGSYGKYWYPRRVMDAWRNRWYAGDL